MVIIMRIYTEVFGGPNDRDLVSVHSDIFSALPDYEINYNYGHEKIPGELAITNYRKCKAFVVFNNKYYFREFFVRNSEDQEQAIKAFRKYFNPIWIK